MKDERAQTENDRQRLLEQITSLVATSASTQEQRWARKVANVQSGMADADAALREADQKYSTSMDSWLQKETQLADSVVKSRDNLKTKLKTDWNTVDQHNLAIQTTTKAVHGETVRIVDAQMSDMATQMAALDDFVTRARSHNESHHTAHVDSLQRLTSSIASSLSTTNTDLQASSTRLSAFTASQDAQTASIISSLPSLGTTVQQPLAALRAAICAAPLAEYSPTGETPQKTQYSYPTSLPRTRPHPQLLASADGLASGPSSPTKSIVYTDKDDSASEGRPPRASTAEPVGLREIAVNVVATGRNSEPPTITMTASGSLADGEHAEADKRGGAMGPPPPMRRGVTDSKVPLRGQGRKGSAEKGEKENAVGPVRRLRSSVRGVERG